MISRLVVQVVKGLETYSKTQPEINSHPQRCGSESSRKGHMDAVPGKRNSFTTLHNDTNPLRIQTFQAFTPENNYQIGFNPKVSTQQETFAQKLKSNPSDAISSLVSSNNNGYRLFSQPYPQASEQQQQQFGVTSVSRGKYDAHAPAFHTKMQHHPNYTAMGREIDESPYGNYYSEGDGGLYGVSPMKPPSQARPQPWGKEGKK